MNPQPHVPLLPGAQRPSGTERRQGRAGCVYLWWQKKKNSTKTEKKIIVNQERAEETTGRFPLGASSSCLPSPGWGGDNTRPPAMRMQPPLPPHCCPPCNTVGEKAHRGQRWGGGGRRERSCETAIILWVIGNGAYVQVLCRGDGRGGK